ncbi:MAG: hypothetical protein JNK85_07060 [Verrucomicrobiales bacterium]|nr:hypothetical protein [Verrucomicrobiales bacterium]
MKLVERIEDRLVFELGAREYTLLERLLSFYPLRPEGAPTLSRSGGERMADAATLLGDALREQRVELAAWISSRLTEGEALLRAGSAWRLTLTLTEVDALLRVFNELRVGAWTRLGSPEDLREEVAATAPGQAPFYVIMTLAGQFEIFLLHALEAEWPPPPPNTPSPP